MMGRLRDEVYDRMWDDSPKRPDMVEEETTKASKPELTLSSETIDHVAIDSLKWHYKSLVEEPEETHDYFMRLLAFKIVLKYYGVTV
jgi:hypothetical protein